MRAELHDSARGPPGKVLASRKAPKKAQSRPFSLAIFSSSSLAPVR